MIPLVLAVCVLCVPCGIWFLLTEPRRRERARGAHRRALAALSTEALRAELLARLEDTPLRDMPSAAALRTNDAVTEEEMHARIRAAYEEAAERKDDPLLAYMFADSGLMYIESELTRRIHARRESLTPPA